MPRAKANPEPAVEEYVTRSGRAYVLEAWRDGSYLVKFGGRTLVNQASRLAAGFGAPRYPSNRLQDEAMAEAKARAEALRDDQH